MSDKDANGDSGKQADSAPSVVSEHEKQLAATATAEFNAGKYGACLDVLDKLRALRPTDGKVSHNRAVARYFAARVPNLDDFGRELTGDVSSQLHLNLSNPDTLDDVDQAVPFFNHAVTLYHSQQYRKALALLDKLFQYIEPLEESIARRICFLHIELGLCLRQPEKVLGLIAYLENLLFGTKTSSSSGESSTGRKSPDKEDDSKDAEELEVYRTKLQQYKVRCFIMLRSMKASKREIKSLVSSGAASNQTIFLRSQLEFLRGNYRKAVKVLCTAQIDSDPKTTAMYHNNIGCIHFYTGKPHLGSYNFEKALRVYTESQRTKSALDNRIYYELLYNLGLQNLYAGKYVSAFDCLVEAVRFQPTNPRLWLRIAECCVNRHKSDNMSDFQLKDRKKNMVRGMAGSGPYRKIILAPSIATDKYVPVGSNQSAAMPMPTLEFATLCLKNALVLLPERVATEQAVSGASVDDSAIPENASSANFTSQAGVDEVSALRNSVLTLSAYVALCLGDVLVALRHAESLLSQPKLSGIHSFLGHQYAAEALLLLDRVPDAVSHLNPDHVKDLSYSFSSETDDSGNKETAKGGATTEENDKAYRKPWYPVTASTAKVVSLYNLAVAYTLRGGLGKASETLRLVSINKGPDPEIPVQALMLAIYVQLQQGHAGLAKSIIKQHLPQYK